MGDHTLINAGDICVGLSSLRADANGSAVGTNTCVADVNIVIAGGEILTGVNTYGDVVAPGRVV
jgi:hypothetical protein